jgi:hypothetical protein
MLPVNKTSVIKIVFFILCFWIQLCEAIKKTAPCKERLYVKWIHLIGNNLFLNFLVHCLEGIYPLRNITQYRRNDIYKRIRDSGRYKIEEYGEEFDKQVAHQDKGHRCQHIPEKLHPAMQVRFGENNMAGQRKPYGEADAERNQPCDYAGRDPDPAVKDEVVSVQEEIIRNKIQKDIQ